MKVLIIDDEPLARSLVREYLQDRPEIEVAGECGDGFEGLKQIQALKPDLVFLDIQMPRITGLEMLELVEDAPMVIFVTAFDQFAVQAFERGAKDYLLKPFSKERLLAALDKCVQAGQKPESAEIGELKAQVGQDLQRIVVKSGQKIHIIPFAGIRYVEACDDYVKIFTKEGGPYMKKLTMKQAEALLPATAFNRVHRSYIVALAEIEKIEPYEKESFLAILKDATRIPVSRSGYGNLRNALRW